MDSRRNGKEIISQDCYYVRNSTVGDIVLIQDNNAVRGIWKLAQVVEAKPGRDGIVRNVKLRYKLSKAGIHYKGIDDKTTYRSVHRL